MNSLISLDLDHNNFGDNLAEPGRFQGLNVLQVPMTLYLNACHFHMIYPILLVHLFHLVHQVHLVQLLHLVHLIHLIHLIQNFK